MERWMRIEIEAFDFCDTDKMYMRGNLLLTK